MPTDCYPHVHFRKRSSKPFRGDFWPVDESVCLPFLTFYAETAAKFSGYHNSLCRPHTLLENFFPLPNIQIVLHSLVEFRATVLKLRQQGRVKAYFSYLNVLIFNINLSNFTKHESNSKRAHSNNLILKKHTK